MTLTLQWSQTLDSVPHRSNSITEQCRMNPGVRLSSFLLTPAEIYWVHPNILTALPLSFSSPFSKHSLQISQSNLLNVYVRSWDVFWISWVEGSHSNSSGPTYLSSLILQHSPPPPCSLHFSYTGLSQFFEYMPSFFLPWILLSPYLYLPLFACPFLGHPSSLNATP